MVGNIGNTLGQSMVEYTVILAVLTIGFMMSAGGDSFEAMETAVQDRQRGYSFAVSMSALPETDDYRELADYYDSLGKYPELAAELRIGTDPVGHFITEYVETAEPLELLELALEPIDPSDYYQR